jgi:hypothetical protein
MRSATARRDFSAWAGFLRAGFNTLRDITISRFKLSGRTISKIRGKFRRDSGIQVQAGYGYAHLAGTRSSEMLGKIAHDHRPAARRRLPHGWSFNLLISEWLTL